MIRVTHLITSLETGGAEWMLTKLLRALPRDEFECSVISLMGEGVLGAELRDAGIRVLPLGMRRGHLNPVAMLRLLRLLSKLQPDVLQTWLYHGDLAGLVAARLMRVPRLLWNVRCSYLDMRDYSLASAVVRKTLAWCSHRPDGIVFNSQAGADIHRALGYRPRVAEIIPNGFDLDAFHPDESAGAALRAELGVSADAVLVGNVARLDPMKDHRTFLRAAAIAAERCPGVHLVLVGAGTEPGNPALDEQVARNGLGGRVHRLGMRMGLERLFAGLDVLVSSSAYGEGFPNVIGEAMACGVPCVATDTGDCRRIIGDTGVVVPPRNPAALAEALLSVLSAGPEGRRDMGARARRRMEENYLLERVTARYAELYRAQVSSQAR